MRIFLSSLTLIFAVFLTAGKETDVVNCNTSEGWTCSIWDQDSQCRGCSKISYIYHEPIQAAQESPVQ